MRSYMRVWVDLYKAFIQLVFVGFILTPFTNNKFSGVFALIFLVSFFALMLLCKKLCYRIDALDTGKE